MTWVMFYLIIGNIYLAAEVSRVVRHTLIFAYLTAALVTSAFQLFEFIKS